MKLLNRNQIDIHRHQIGLETLMGSSDCIFDCVHIFFCKCHKIGFKWSISNVDSPDWIKSKKATINSINKKDNKCFQYAVTVGLYND